MSRQGKYVATTSMSRPMSRQAVVCRDQCRDKQSVATDVATSSSMSRPVSRQASFVAIRRLCRDQNAAETLKKIEI